MTDSDCTFIGLHNWFEHVFEHHGWVLLCHQKCKAKNGQCCTKCQAHVDGMDKLRQHLEKKQNQKGMNDARNSGQVDDSHVDNASKPVVPGVFFQVDGRTHR